MDEPLPRGVNEYQENMSGTAERSEAETHIETVRQQKGIFVEAVRVTRMPMMVTDSTLPGNPIVFANDAFIELCGYSMEELVGQDPHFMNGEGTDPAAIQQYETSMNHGRHDDLEILQYRKDGSPFRAMLYASPLQDEQGRITNHFLSYLDITRRYQAEESLRALTITLESRVASRTKELLRSNEELQRFANVISHDLREPLRTVNAYIKMLQKRYQHNLDDDANELINYASDACNRMGSMLGAILDYARATSYEQELVEVDLNSVIRSVLANLNDLMETTGTAVVVPEPLPTVYSNEFRFAQIFQNLIANAVKFQPAGQTARIEITCRRVFEFWEFKVKDNGIGFRPEDAERMFEIFQRLNRREDYPGTGAGLAIVRKIIEVFGGTIWAASDGPNTGATFTFTIPAIPSRRKDDPAANP